MAGKAGKKMTCVLNSKTMQVKTFTVNGSCDLLNNTHSGSNGEEELVEGITSCSGTIGGDYDPTNSYLEEMTPGEGSVANLVLETDSDDSHSMTAAVIYVESLEVSADIAGMITWTANWKGSGVDLATLFGSLNA